MPAGRRASRAPGVATLTTVVLAAGTLAAGCGEKDEPTGTLATEPPATETSATETSATTPPPAFRILGHFRGRLAQRGLKPFRIDVRIGSLRSPARNPVRYSGLDCAGTWRYLGKDGAVFRFRERISSGRSRKCKGVGTVTLRPLGPDRLAYRFRGGGVTSSGTLSRVN